MTITTDAGARVQAVRRFADLRVGDVDYAGGKGANLGELTAAGLPVPPGFVVGAPAYAAFCEETGLRARLDELLAKVDVEDTAALAAAAEQARALVDQTPMSGWLEAEIRSAYAELARADDQAPVAVRSSATAEDTASASFAGMNETFLNVRGADSVIDAVRSCWRSLFGARTVYYRGLRGFSQAAMDIAVVVQRQIQSTRAGVMFTVNPASGDRAQLVIEGALGLGEAVVSGSVSPDRYLVDKATLAIRAREVHHKELIIESTPDGGTVTRALSEDDALAPVLSDEEVVTLASLGRQIEEHYGTPQDTEWAFDPDGAAWMLQSRPVTTLHGEQAPASTEPQGTVLLHGLGGAPGSASGAVRVLATLADAARLGNGEVLVTHMTAPDWVPLMRRAAAIVTDSGGMTCHAAIVSRELGIPCVVGTGQATKQLRDGEIVTVDATHGVVIEGAAAAPAAPPASVITAGPSRMITGTQVLVNLSEPSQVEHAAGLDVDGVGLLRAELMVLEALHGDHPRTLLAEGRGDEFVDAMAAGLTTFAAGFAPRPVTYRTIDFRTNEFRGLRGGDEFEPEESNPMIGYRGALRYTQEPDVFALELAALHRVWDAGHRQPARDAAVRADDARARALPSVDRGIGPARPAWLRAVGHGRGSFGPVQPRRVRGAWCRGDFGRIKRPHAAAARRRPRQRGARGDVRRARSCGCRLPAPADPTRARARTADIDLRPGAIGPPRVRRALGPRRHRLRVSEHGRRRSHPRADRRRRAASSPRRVSQLMFKVRIHGRSRQAFGSNRVIGGRSLMSATTRPDAA
jgi:pyruvate,water dikinase